MIATGTDIISLQRIKAVFERNGDKFIHRILTEKEISEMPEYKQPKIAFLSKRWAAKEAISKAFGTGIGAELSFLDIEIAHEISGQPRVELGKKSIELARQKGISRFSISISDEKNYAIAFVIALSDDG